MVSHRALGISEIVQNIADFILPSKQSLTAMARTCKAFYEPSMNALWREIPHIGILFDCFPENVWQKPNRGPVRFQLLVPPFVIALTLF